MERILGMKLFTKRLPFGQFKDLFFEVVSTSWKKPSWDPLISLQNHSSAFLFATPSFPNPASHFVFVFSSPQTRKRLLCEGR
jgi:hypothetical protein